MASEGNSLALQEILRGVRRIEIQSRRLVNHVFQGEYQSVFRGKGMEFADVREYEPGDDVRNIDWNVTARMGSPYIKKFVEERELTVYLLVDASASSLFGTAGRSKLDVAIEICALLALAAVKNNDRVGLIAFSDRLEKVIPPRKGSRHALRLIRDLLALDALGRGTDIACALNHLGSVAHRRSIIFLLSDFLCQNYERVLKVAAHRHDIIAIIMSDPREVVLPPLGLVEIEDPESGRYVLVDTSDPGVRREYAQSAARLKDGRNRILNAAGADRVEVPIHQGYVKPLLNFFQSRVAGR